MNISYFPNKDTWESICERPILAQQQLSSIVNAVMEKLKIQGDQALYAYTKEFDGVQLDSLLVSKAEMDFAIEQVPADLKLAIIGAAQNIQKFHSQQLVPESIVETMPGVTCWRKSVGIEKVGLYIPGGTAPLFSTLLMLGIPANLAGCREIILCTPPAKNGSINSTILFTANFLGINKLFKVGGAPAIAAMTYGTQTIPKVDKIFGPGNQYVTAAKLAAQQAGVAIDMPAGPSEVCVLADESANAAFVAADLLSQAEHGVDSQVMLVSVSEKLIKEVLVCLEQQLASLPRKEMAAAALKNSHFVLLNSLEEAIELVNLYAAEHLIISCESAQRLADKVINAGSVFIGNYSPESAGDYASGTNHTLPTNRTARAYSGISVDSFEKKITYQHLTKEGLMNLADTVVTMAKAEGLTAHANAISIRL